MCVRVSLCVFSYVLCVQLLSLVGLASLAGRFSCAYIVERIGSVQVVRLGLYGSLVGLTFFLYDACMHDYYPNQHGSAFYLLLMYVLIGGFAHGTQIPSETILVGTYVCACVYCVNLGCEAVYYVRAAVRGLYGLCTASSLMVALSFQSSPHLLIHRRCVCAYSIRRCSCA